MAAPDILPRLSNCISTNLPKRLQNIKEVINMISILWNLELLHLKKKHGISKSTNISQIDSLKDTGKILLARPASSLVYLQQETKCTKALETHRNSICFTITADNYQQGVLELSLGFLTTTSSILLIRHAL